MSIKEFIHRYATLRSTMLTTFQSDSKAYYSAEQEMSKLIAEAWQSESSDIIAQAMHYQNIIIDCERYMPLPMEQDTRTAGNYNIHRYTQEEYQATKDNLERLLQSCENRKE